MSPSEHLLEQSAVGKQDRRGFWEHFCVNPDDESKACCLIIENGFQGYSGIGISLSSESGISGTLFSVSFS